MNDYLYYMPALKRLEAEQHPEPMLRMMQVMLNSAMEKRLKEGTHTPADIEMLEARMTDRDRTRRPAVHVECDMKVEGVGQGLSFTDLDQFIDNYIPFGALAAHLEISPALLSLILDADQKGLGGFLTVRSDGYFYNDIRLTTTGVDGFVYAGGAGVERAVLRGFSPERPMRR